MEFTPDELIKVQAYLRDTFKNPGLAVRPRSQPLRLPSVRRLRGRYNGRMPGTGCAAA